MVQAESIKCAGEICIQMKCGDQFLSYESTNETLLILLHRSTVEQMFVLAREDFTHHAQYFFRSFINQSLLPVNHLSTHPLYFGTVPGLVPGYTTACRVTRQRTRKCAGYSGATDGVLLGRLPPPPTTHFLAGAGCLGSVCC